MLRKQQTFFMSFLNVEIKSRTSNPSAVRNYLLKNEADYKGTDQQTDTYFNVNNGRLKLREGNIETNLIFYERSTVPGPKSSQFNLVKVADPAGLKNALECSLGIKIVVRKEREIYYIKNVKFHIDNLPGLGDFFEIEAGNMLADLTQSELRQQCEFYLKELGIKKEDLISESYSDMIMNMVSINVL